MYCLKALLIKSRAFYAVGFETGEDMKKIKKLIDEAENIAILTHISEDADAVATSAALKCVLGNMGKTADIYMSDTPEDRLSFMNVEAFVYDDKATIPEYDLCICVDCGDLNRLGSRTAIFEKAKHTCNIDHHITNNGFAEANLVKADASSAAEVLYGLLLYMGAEITKQTAFYLYIAIASDCGCFKYGCASPETLRIAANLMETGIDHADICRRLFDTEKRETLRLKGYLSQNIKEYANGAVCLVSLDLKTQEQFGTDEKNSGDIVNIPRSVQGCEIAVSIRETSEKIKVSLRSNGKYDVSHIAGKFGGGGHKAAAGISFKDIDMTEAEKRVIDACLKEIEENRK